MFGCADHVSCPISVLVVQMGARRGYEMARMLEDRGVLAALHTSTAWAEGARPSSFYTKLSGLSDGVLRRRTIRGIPRRKIRATFLPEPFGAVVQAIGLNEEIRYRFEDWILGQSIRRVGLAGASIVLNTAGNGGTSFLKWARGQGALIATDVVITPKVYDIIAEEHRRWPGWEASDKSQANAVRYREYMEGLVEVSDLLISPSETVDDGLATLSGFDHSKLVRVPYGLGGLTPQAGEPVTRRVLFAGQAGLRKGLPYLAEAGRLLKPLGYEIRVAGVAPPSVRMRPECDALTFLGYLGPDEMAAEFRSADVFCLPSLAEGMASVTLEALAHGLPCIVTRSAGAPVQDGWNGLVVPERDGRSIADAVQVVASDRLVRARMSAAALETASSHSIGLVGARLHAALQGLMLANG